MQGFPQSVTRIEIEDRLNLGRRFIGEVNEGSAARYGHQHRCGALLYRKLDKVEWVMDRLDRPTKVQPADNREPTLQRPVEKRRAERRKRRNTEIRSTLSRIEGAELHSEFVFARVAIPYQFQGSAIQVLFGNPYALAERGRRRLIQNAHAGTGSLRYLDPIEARWLVLTARTDRPNLPSGKRIAPDAILTLQLRRGHEVLDSIRPQTVAELGVAKLRGSYALLLLSASQFCAKKYQTYFTRNQQNP